MKKIMHTSLRTALIALCALAVFTPQAKADIQAIHHEDNEVWGSVGTELFNYKEPNVTAGVSDSEHGWVPSIAAGVSLLGSSTDVHGMLPSNIYFSLDANVSFGNAHYNGFLQTTPPTPTQTTTNETIVNVDSRLGRGFALSNSVMVIPYGEIDFRNWRRDIGQGEIETYHNINALGGAMLQVAPTDRLVLSVYGSAGTTLDAQMKDWKGNNFALGGAGVYKVGGKIGFDVAPRVELFATMDYDHFHYTKSPWYTDKADATMIVMEPTSRTEDTTMRVGMGYQFN